MTERNQEQATETQETTDRGDRFIWREGEVQITPPSEKAQETEAEMEQAEDETSKPVHHATIKGANLAVARKEISADSCRAVVAGEITLQQAKAYGRDLDRHGNPVKSETPKKATKTTTEPTLTPCLCGCQALVPKTFKAGHDMAMFRVAREHLTEGREITDAQREYLEISGKMQRVKDKLAADEAKRQEKIAAKADAQRKKEGEQ